MPNFVRRLINKVKMAQMKIRKITHSFLPASSLSSSSSSLLWEFGCLWKDKKGSGRGTLGTPLNILGPCHPCGGDGDDDDDDGDELHSISLALAIHENDDKEEGCYGEKLQCRVWSTKDCFARNCKQWHWQNLFLAFLAQDNDGRKRDNTQSKLI